MNDAAYMDIAVHEALRGITRGHGGPFGAVIVRNGKVIAQAHNTVLGTQDPVHHAEINAIQQAVRRIKKFSLKGARIYSTTEPCPMCFAAIHWAQIGTLTYATTIADVKKLGFNEMPISNSTLKKLGRLKITIRRIKHASAHALLDSWNQLPMRRTY